MSQALPLGRWRPSDIFRAIPRIQFWKLIPRGQAPTKLTTRFRANGDAARGENGVEYLVTDRIVRRSQRHQGAKEKARRLRQPAY